MLALVNNEPKILTLKQMLQHYLDFQVDVIQRRTRFDLRKALERAHILQGFVLAADHIDEVINIIRSSATVQEAKERMIERFRDVDMSALLDRAQYDLTGLHIEAQTGLSQEQAEAIVQMRLGQLTGLERQKITDELYGLLTKISDYEDILADVNIVYAIILEDLNTIRKKFSDKRRTDIENVSGEVDIEDLIPEEDCVVTLTNNGYIKRMPLTEYKTQHRGGRGITGMKQREEDFVQEMFMGIGEDFDIEKLRYGKVIIMADADVDGMHIRTLLLTFFFRYMRPLITNGNVYIAQPPLFRVERKKKIYYAFSDEERDKYIAELSEDGKYKDVEVQRYKGLGEMDPEQLWETTMDPEHRTIVRIGMEDALKADETFSILMGDKADYDIRTGSTHAGVNRDEILIKINGVSAKDYGSVYVTSETFGSDLVSALNKSSISDFHDKYRNADILLIDDIQFFSGRERMQEEFFHTFYKLHQEGKQIVITSDKPPKELLTLEERLRTRFEGGLIADISAPDYETRLAIINRKSELLELKMPSEVAEFMANRLKSNIRQLEGAVVRLDVFLHKSLLFLFPVHLLP